MSIEKGKVTLRWFTSSCIYMLIINNKGDIVMMTMKFMIEYIDPSHQQWPNDQADFPVDLYSSHETQPLPLSEISIALFCFYT